MVKQVGNFTSLIIMNLKRLRKARRLSQQQLADELGMNRVTVANWESGSATPSAETFDKMAAIFECQVGEFFVPEGHDALNRRSREIQECFLEVMEYTRNKLLEDLQRSQDKATIDHFNEGITKLVAHPHPPPIVKRNDPA